MTAGSRRQQTCHDKEPHQKTSAEPHLELLVVEDTRLDPRFSDNPSVAGPPWVRFYAGAPLVDAEGYCLGTFCLVDLQPHSLKPAEISRLVHFSQRAMRLIEMQKAMSALLGTYNAPPAGHVATGGYAASPP